jgi:hypothetical protein
MKPSHRSIRPAPGSASGSLGGLAVLFVGSLLIAWTGSWLGGNATSAQIRTAMAWSDVPLAAFLGLTLVLIAATGPLPFHELVVIADQSFGHAVGTMLVGFAAVALGVWAFVLLLHGVGEAHGFSAWRALGNVALALVLLMLPFFVLGLWLALV